ncbi:hypothetical protein GC197_03185 [bacterium]|nr:hypothetical protein [bacterium]
MSVTSNSPLDVLVTAWAVAKQALPAHRHLNSPKKFTQHQLFACLVLKNCLRLDYRGVVEQLLDCPSLCEAIELNYIPHYTTLQKAAQRLLACDAVQSLLDKTVAMQMGRRKCVPAAAVETVMSMLKRRQGNFCRGRTEVSRNKELYLMLLTHNVMILWWA